MDFGAANRLDEILGLNQLPDATNKNEPCMKTNIANPCVLLALIAVITAVALPAQAQQTTGTPGSPGATTHKR